LKKINHADSRTKIVSIGSSSKKAGKSTLASYLVRELGADFGLKVSCGDEHAPARAITTDPDVISQPGTDTGALVAAGARVVLWVNTGRANLGKEINRALGMFPAGGLLVTEGNSVLANLEADFAVFLMNVPFEAFKPSAFPALSRADLVLVDRGGPLGTVAQEQLEREIRERAGAAGIISYDDDSGRTLAWGETARLISRRLALQVKENHP